MSDAANHVVTHVKHERGMCRCGREPKRAGGGGNCLICHAEAQARHRKKVADELALLRALSAAPRERHEPL